MKLWSPWPKPSGARRSGSMPSSQSSNATFPTGDIEAVLTKRPALVKLTPENETTDEHRAAQPQPKRISPQRRGERRGRPWERTKILYNLATIFPTFLWFFLGVRKLACALTDSEQTPREEKRQQALNLTRISSMPAPRCWATKWSYAPKERKEISQG